MKHIAAAILLLCLASAAATAQLQLLEENFSYTFTGTAADSLRGKGSPSWSLSLSNAYPVIALANASLSYPGYPSSGTGLAATVTASGQDLWKAYTNRDTINASTQAGTSVYASMLVRVDSAGSGDYFFSHFYNNTYRGRLMVKSDGAGFQFGVTKSGATPLAYTTGTPYVYGTTYLVVVKLTIVAGGTNDSVFLFVNPSLSGPEPAPLLATSDNGSDLAYVVGVALRQGGGSGTAPTVLVDGIRVSTGWSLSPLPVQLSAFSARRTGTQMVRLDWTTLGEVNNYGFFVQRRLRGASSFADLPGGFVPGHGTTTIPHDYAFADAAAGVEVEAYRLRQVDLDGAVHFTDPVLVESPMGVEDRVPGAFALDQNYPNPFNPETVIQFAVQRAPWVTLAVYDLLGREVAVLVDGAMPPGRYSVRFDASNLPSGAYVYRLRAGAAQATRTLMLLK